MKNDVDLRVNDVGPTIRATITDKGTGSAVDLSVGTFTSVYFVIKKRDGGTASTLTATAFNTDGSDGKVNYSMTSAIFPSAGTWQIQAIFENGTNKFHSSIEQIIVGENL